MAGPNPPDQAAAPTSTNRVIPGLSNPAQLPSSHSSAKRSRKKKAASKSDQTSKLTNDQVTAPEPTIEPTSGLGLGLDPNHEGPNGSLAQAPPPALTSTSVSPVQQVQKRIRAVNKKLQRVSGYESSTGPLNEDQKRAIASKPALEATVKELQDLLKILEEDEKLEEVRIQAVREEEELKVKGRVDSAIAIEQKKANSNLTLLLQFLHLYSLFTSSRGPSDSLVPSILPAIVESATTQELAAVNTLFHQLADGPIAGGGGDAFEAIERFAQGSEQEIISGVTFGRVRTMVLQLTAPPAEAMISSTQVRIAGSNSDIPHLEDELVSAHLSPPAPSSNLMFLQQSEVVPQPTLCVPNEPIGSVEPLPAPSVPQPAVEGQPTVDHVTRNKQLLETAEIIGPDPAPLSSEWTAPQPGLHPSDSTPPVAASNEWTNTPPHLSVAEAEVVARTIDWAEDVQEVQNSDGTTAGNSIVPSPQPPSGDHFSAQPQPPPHGHHHFHSNGRGNYRGRGGGYRGGPGPRGSGHPDGYRGGYRGAGYRGGGFRGGRGGPPVDVNGGGGWRPGPGGPPPDNSGGYRPRAEYPGGRYGGHRGGSRGGPGLGYHRPSMPPQGCHPEATAVPGEWS